MRRLMGGLLCGALVLGTGVPARAHHGAEFGLAMGAAASNLVYFPVKLTMAGLGLPLGALAGLFTGGNTRAAYAVWVPTASGTYLLTPDHLEGTKDIEFIGNDYADRPSTMQRETDGSRMYDALYESR